MSQTIGLDNLGNTCFMNSSLQCLRNVYPLTEYLLDLKSNYFRNNLLNEYINLLKQFNTKYNYKSISPNSFKYTLEYYYSKYRGYQQHDSGEFLASLLSILNDELKAVDSYITDNYNKREVQDYFNKNKTIITQLFLTLTCSTINNDVQELEPNYIIDLPIISSDNYYLETLEDCLDEFQKAKKIKGNFHGTSSNKIYLTSDYIIFNLKRVRKGVHISNLIKYPEILDLKPYSLNLSGKSTKYSLVSFIKHIGDEKFGHKIAYCKDYDNNWHIYNDSEHTPLNRFPDKENLAFLFIYERIGSTKIKKTKIKKNEQKHNTKNMKKKKELIKNEEESEEEEEEEEEIEEPKENNKIIELIKKSEINFELIKKNNNKMNKEEMQLNLDKLYELIYSNFKIDKLKDLIKYIDYNNSLSIDENGFIPLKTFLEFFDKQKISLKDIKIDLFKLFSNYEEYIQNLQIKNMSKEKVKKLFKNLKKKLDEKNFKKMKEFKEAKSYNAINLENFLKTSKLKINIKDELSLAINKEIKNPITLSRFYDILENSTK